MRICGIFLSSLLLLMMATSGCCLLKTDDKLQCKTADNQNRAANNTCDPVAPDLREHDVIPVDIDHFSDRFYDPEFHSLYLDQIKEFQPCGTLVLQNCQQHSLVFLGEYNHQWFGDPRLWTAGVQRILEREWNRRYGLAEDGSCHRILRLKVTDMQLFWQTRKIECRVTLEVRTGSGETYNFTVHHVANDLYGSCNMALGRSATAVFNEPEIRKYLTGGCESGCGEVKKESSVVPSLENEKNVDQLFQPGEKILNNSGN